MLGGPDLTFHPNNMGIPYKLAIVLKQRLKFKILQGTQSWAQHIAYSKSSLYRYLCCYVNNMAAMGASRLLTGVTIQNNPIKSQNDHLKLDYTYKTEEEKKARTNLNPTYPKMSKNSQ